MVGKFVDHHLSLKSDSQSVENVGVLSSYWHLSRVSKKPGLPLGEQRYL